MSDKRAAFRLILIGAGPRVAVGLLIIGLLWLGFFWATANPGPL
ncbi:MAG: hypothetical protein AAF667_01240 [Pseudomonadota bacterium]